MSATALDRQIRAIYDSLETGSPKTALVSCNKLLKKQPKNNLVKALKALALVRSQKTDEAIVLCDEVLATRCTDDATLSAMQHVLRGLGRHIDTITMFENAYKQQPANEDLGAQTFFANVRTGNWKTAQQVATKMHKQFRDDRYLYWGVMSTVLQANDAETPPAMRTLLYKLAHRLVTSSPSPSHLFPDRFHLHISILRELELYDDAYTLLDSDVGKQICSTSLSCNEVRWDIWRRKGLWKEEGVRAAKRIVQKTDRNWPEFLSVLDATFCSVGLCTGLNPSESAKTECLESISTTRELFTRLSKQDGRNDRSAPLALMELEKRARSHGLSTDPDAMVQLMERYFNLFGDKACCFEDLKPYLSLDKADLMRWTTFLESIPLCSETVSDLRQSINVHALLRYNLSPEQITPELESSRAVQYLKDYMRGLKLGKKLPPTELQPADDLAILAGQAFVDVWKLTDDQTYLFNCVSVLEFALTKSLHSYQMRLMLVRIYTLLGAPSLALEHYRAMGIKNVQNDTLSHFVLSRASTFSLAATGDITYSSECIESSQIYNSNSQETSEFIVRAFTSEKYSQIPGFIDFEDRLDNSLARDTVKIEHVRMRIAHEQITTDLIDLELIELKFIFNRLHHDNRDFAILPNYQPHSSQSFHEQTLLFKKSTGLGWLSAFLKIYISVLQQASDLDDSVEEKLLVGDRPKPSNNPNCRLPWKDRLSTGSPEELDELTPDEVSFFDYALAVANWLEPYHNHIRPPPVAALSEPTKKAGPKSSKVELTPQSGQASNEHGKKEEEVPPIKEPPEIVTKFFDDMNARFMDILGSKRLTSEALHIVTLTQEAMILLVIDTLRFKPSSVVKVYKLGALVHDFKVILAKATEVLREMSSELLKIGNSEGTIDSRKAFVDGCKLVTALTEIDHDFVLNVAKRVTDARKRVQEGMGRGVSKLCATY